MTKANVGGKHNRGMETGDRIRSLIGLHLGLDAVEVTDDSRLADDLGADSLDFVELVIALEDEFKLVLQDVDGDTVWFGGDPDRQGAVSGEGTVLMLVQLVEKRIAAKARKQGAA